MKKEIYYFFLILIATLISCEKEIDINVDNFVVNAFISDYSPFIITATKTVSVFDTATYTSFKYLEGELYENGNYVGNFTYQESYQREGLPGEVPEGYSISGFVPEQGKEYSFELRDGDVVIQGSDVIPVAVNFTVDTSLVFDENDLFIKGTECILHFTDPAGEDNYYALAYNFTEFSDEADTIGWTQPLGWMISDDPAIEYNYYFEGMLNTGYNFIFSDVYFNGKDYSLPVTIFGGRNGGFRTHLNIYLFCVSEQYYRYVTSSIKQRENNEDYYAEPTQVFNNIENGFGIFAGFSVSAQIIEFGD